MCNNQENEKKIIKKMGRGSETIKIELKEAKKIKGIWKR